MKLSLHSQNLTSLTGTLAVFVLCLTSIVLLQRDRLQLKSSQLTKAEYLRQEQTEKVSLNILSKIPVFGFKNLLSDLICLRFIQYFGDGEAREKIGYSLSPEYFAAIVERNPQFVESYLLLAPATSIFAGQPQKTVALIKQGLKSISPETSPLSYYLWIYKGVDEMLFLGDTKAAKQSYEMAAKWAETYNNPASQATAANARQTAQFLAKDPNSKIARIGAWTMVLSSAPDEKTQQRAISQIKALGGEIIITPDGRLSVKAPKKDKRKVSGK
jgi:hypothetical protein